MASVRDREFEDFVRDHGPGLVRRARLLCRHRADADDVTQETLTRLYAHWNRVERSNNRAGYAHQVLYRVFLDTRRKASRRELSTADPPETRHPGSFEETVEARERVSEALSVLKPHQRIVLVARYLDDLSVDEVASTLHRTPGWVRITCFRALQTIREHLRQFDTDQHLANSAEAELPARPAGARRLIPQGEHHV